MRPRELVSLGRFGFSVHILALDIATETRFAGAMIRRSRPTSLALLLASSLAACSPVAPRDAGVDALDDLADDADAQALPADARIVGVTTRTWTDPTRTTPANGDAGAHDGRTLATEVWYPALGIAGTEGRDAPPVSSTAGYPLVLFVHGSSGSRRTSASITRALAGAGFVVAAADFPLTAFGTPGGASDLHVDDQLGDLRFLADQLDAASRDESDLLAHAIDATHYVVAGHSTGGTVALLAAYAPDIHDARVAGAAALAPCACFFNDVLFTTRSMPLLVMAGTDDHFVPYENNGARAYALATPPKDMVALVGGNHLYFTDLRVSDDTLMPMPTTAHDDIAIALARYGGGTACDPSPAPGADPLMAFDAQHRHTIEWLTAFANATLRGDGSSLTALRARADADLRAQHQP